MKSLFAIILISYALYKIRTYSIEKENFMYFKCIAYLFISSIHSVVLSIPIPLGAAIMGCFSLIDHKNKHIKWRMIRTGVLIVLLSVLNFQHFTYPLQKLYLQYVIQTTSKIDVYAYNDTHENFLFSITDSTDIAHWMDQLTASMPSTHWNHKPLGSNLGYKLMATTTTGKQIPIRLSPYMATSTNLFIGDTYIPYSNTTILSYLSSIYSNTPSNLTINTSKSAAINIQNPIILNDLWRMILWGIPYETQVFPTETFTVPSYLFFEKYLGCRLSFTTNFKYVLVNSKDVFELPSHLQTSLSEQYVLSQLDYVNELTDFEPAHASNPPNTSLNYSIQLAPNELYYALYLHDYKTNDTALLHSVSSANAEFFILKYPYILLLDQKAPDSYDLMLVNQNIPEKHRYIVKSDTIIPRSLSLCPQNAQFTYILDKGDTSTLYLVSDYYRSPKVIATGNISDSLFLSDDYLLFTQQLDGKSLLCIYSLSHQQTIKYIPIPGQITLTESNENQITFAVQSIEGLNLKEALFCIDDNLNLYKKKRH